jgi:hypothetical protein
MLVHAGRAVHRFLAIDRRCLFDHAFDALHVLAASEGDVTCTAHHNDMQRALYLVPLDSDSLVKPFACKLREVVKIGRTKANELPASVSRAAVEVTAKVAGGTSHLHVLVRSTVHVRRAAEPQATRHSAGEELQVRARMMLHALCVTLQGYSRGNRSGCPAPAGGRRPALPWQARAGQWLQRSGELEWRMHLSDGCHIMHGGKSLDRRLSVRLQASKRSNTTGSAAEQPAKRKKLLSGGSGPSSAPSGKRQALSGASSSGCHPAEAPIAAAAGPLSGLHLKFWRLNFSKQLHEQVPDSCS